MKSKGKRTFEDRFLIEKKVELLFHLKFFLNLIHGQEFSNFLSDCYFIMFTI